MPMGFVLSYGIGRAGYEVAAYLRLTVAGQGIGRCHTAGYPRALQESGDVKDDCSNSIFYGFALRAGGD